MFKSPLPWLVVALSVAAIVAVVGLGGAAQGAEANLERPPTAPTLEAFQANAEVQLKLWREELASVAAEIDVKGNLDLREQVQRLQEKLELAQDKLDALRLASAGSLVKLQLELERLMWELSRSIETLRSR
ncbi:MAG TPA: hypothetical protein VJ345_05695 [Anaerolineales bacterium]|nr:hypothetical protein [Anaerolineales bacterium]